jgi:hypothetical protein
LTTSKIISFQFFFKFLKFFSHLWQTFAIKKKRLMKAPEKIGEDEEGDGKNTSVISWSF